MRDNWFELQSIKLLNQNYSLFYRLQKKRSEIDWACDESRCSSDIIFR